MFFFWLFMLIMNLLIPAVMIIFGRIFLKNPPSKINSTYGYRTKRSMKNRDTWEFAHKCIGKIWYLAGIVLGAASVFAMLLVYNHEIEKVSIFGLVLCFIQVGLMALTIIPVEVLLSKTFDNNGKRKL